MSQKERSRRHYLANRPAYLVRARNQRKYAKAKLSPERLIYNRIKASAKARGLEFDLEPADIIIPDVCPYLGVGLEFGEGKQKKNSYSVDRIDSSKGYIKGNIEVISLLANMMKQDSTQDEQIRFAKEVLRRHEIS
jgi:hypothetical protein